jgi:Aspartyl protease
MNPIMTCKLPLLAVSALLACLPEIASGKCLMTRIVEMPVTMTGLIPIVTGQVNGLDVHFIADSGAYYSLLTTPAAKRFESPLKSGPVNLLVEGAGGIQKMQITKVKDLTLVGHTYHGVDSMVGGDLFGQEADGLLGQNFFRAADAEFDLARCAVPDSDGASSILSRQKEDALWEVFFTVAPARRRVFEPSSKHRKRAAGPLPHVTG